ncbi:MAG TPA: tetratricopeptide repeat protein, partial [Ktedonobacteraceae bacterium]|nr:tetratricopeptide repeat protein [Ktedonobacteraceae bacterium]
MAGNKELFSTAMNAADRYRWESQWEEAAREYKRALAEFPEDVMARGGLGFCYMQTKQWHQALAEYEYILNRDPSNIIALSKTAELYVILAQREDAYKAYLHLAGLYSQAGQGSRAEAAWQKAVQLSPDSPEPLERLAEYYFGKKDIGLMIQARLATAQAHLTQNNLVSARVHCEEVLRADGNNIQAQQLLKQITAMGQMHPPGLQQSEASQSFSATLDSLRGSPIQAGGPVSPMAFTGSPTTSTGRSGNISGGNTGIMGNMGMGNSGNFGGGGNPGQNPAMAGGPGGGGMGQAPRKRITANQVTGVLRQAQTFQTQGRFNDAIDLCEQILESGFDRPDARYFLGWLYQEQQRWDDAIRQFQMLLNDPDYALSCYYALGQCYRARGDLRTATVHFDEAVDRVNLDALTLEESDQLVQLCQEAADAHRQLGEQDQALTVYNALLGFLRSRGWNDKVTQVEGMLQQMQNSPAPQSGALQNPGMPSQDLPEAPTMAFNANSIPPAPQQQQQYGMPPQQQQQQQPYGMQQQQQPPSAPLPPPAQQAGQVNPISSVGELPDWLTGILNDDKGPVVNKPVPPAVPAPQQPSFLNEQPIEQAPPPMSAQQSPAASWLVDNAPGSPQQTPDPLAQLQQAQPFNSGPMPPVSQQASGQLMQQPQQPNISGQLTQAQQQMPPVTPMETGTKEPTTPLPGASPLARAKNDIPDGAFMDFLNPVAPTSGQANNAGQQKTGEDLLSQMAGQSGPLRNAAEAVLTSTASLPEPTRSQVVQAMRDIQQYINHGLLIQATEACLRVIDMAPQYVDVHQILCEIYVRQGKIEQAITKYAILVDTFMMNGRTDDAAATYRRILQLEPSNLTYRMRLISLLASQGNKEELLRERTLAAESYLRLGYTDRALYELEEALKESPTSVPTRLNYALALQKLGRNQQAVVEYQRVLQVDPRNLVALIRWHIAMVTSLNASRTNALEVLSRIRWQLRGEGQRNSDMIIREYNQAADMYPNNADIQFALGQIYQQAGSYDQALDAYTLATRDSATEVMARVSSASCLLIQGKPEAAISQLEQALQSARRSGSAIDPASWAARPREEGEEHQAPEVEISKLLANAYGRTGRQDQQQAILRKVKQGTTMQNEVSSAISDIASRQTDKNLTMQEYLELVQHYRSKRQVDNALGVLNEMVRLDPQDPRAHAELGDIYINRGLLDEGIAELRMLSDIYLRQNKPEEAGEVLRRVGNIYAETDNPEDAMQTLRRAAELRPKDMDLLREVVSYCYQWGAPQDAVSYQIMIARYYFDTHQVKESVAALQQLIALDRNNFEAYDMLG